MKYLVILTDGAADEPVAALNNKTPLEAAEMPNADKLASASETGLVSTVPEGMPPGSDVANLAVMGYNPRVYHTGRSPLEAASIGVSLLDTDVAYRCNMVTLADKTGSFQADIPYEDLAMVDHAAGDISTEDCTVLLNAVREHFETEGIRFYPGTSYRHCMVVDHGKTHYKLTPPHDILTQGVAPYLPSGEGADFLTKMMRESYEILKDHPLNLARIAAGKHPANSIWLWGLGTKPSLSPLLGKYGVKGSCISAVDLIKGISILAGMDSIDVPGATGNIDTDFDAKVRAVKAEFDRGQDFVYLHLEAPDECGHQGIPEEKKRALELIDSRVIGPLMDFMAGLGEPYRILLMPDHPTPLRIRTHAARPVPYIFFDSTKPCAPDPSKTYTESSAARFGEPYSFVTELTDSFFRK